MRHGWFSNPSAFGVLAAFAMISFLVSACAERQPGAGSETRSTAQPGDTATIDPPMGSMLNIPSGADSIRAYLSPPEGRPKAFVVVVQEWWGLDRWIQSVADRFARQGYLAIAPDLYQGKVANDPELAHELLRGLPDERAIGDIRAAAAFARGFKEGKGMKGGVIGFCAGGRLAQLASLDRGPFEATVICYGSPVTTPVRLATLPGPVLGVFGKEDRGIGPDQAAALEKGLREAGKTGIIRTYEGAGHAFLNDTRPSYVPGAAQEAWGEIDAFLAKNLTSG